MRARALMSSILQVVRDFLLHGPVTIKGKLYVHLCDYYFDLSKAIQVGNSCNVQKSTVSQMIRNPTLLLDGVLLNSPSAIACDVVHWGLKDYARWRTARQHNVQCKVQLNYFACYKQMCLYF
jgi:hypothetical protein